MKRLCIFSVLLFSLSIFLLSCGPSAVVVRERPSPPVVVRSVSPGPGYVWIEGNYIRSGRGYTYRQGYWAVPPGGRVTYTPGYWAPRRNGYYYRRGHW